MKSTTIKYLYLLSSMIVFILIQFLFAYHIDNNKPELNNEISIFENAYLINRYSRTDRLLESCDLLDREGIKVKLWEAIDKDSDFIVRLLQNMDPSKRRGNGELACFASHYGILRLVIAQSFPITLILEDDFNVNTGAFVIAKEILATLKMDWGMIFLGHCLEDHSGIIVASLDKYGYHLEKSVRPRCTHAYLVSLSGATKLLKLLPIISEAYDNIDE